VAHVSTRSMFPPHASAEQHASTSVWHRAAMHAPHVVSRPRNAQWSPISSDEMKKMQPGAASPSPIIHVRIHAPTRMRRHYQGRARVEASSRENLRGTVTTSARNFVRAAIPITFAWFSMKPALGPVGAALALGVFCIALALWALSGLAATFGADLDVLEV